jgi:hypothetical protein
MLDTTRAAAWYRIQSVLAASTAGVIGSLWDTIDPDNIASSWRAQLPLATDAVAYGSRRAASGSSAYVAATIADEGVDPLNVTVNVSRLVSRPVTSARLAVPMLRTLERIGRGDSVTESLASGRLLATVIGAQTTRDTARDAVGIAQITEPRVHGWVRYLVTPSCGRCAVLAGRVYAWSDGFARHPSCDCQHRSIVDGQMPAARSSVEGSASDYFGSLSEADQNKYFGTGTADSIRAGGNLNRAVNADRNMWRERSPRRSVGDLPRPIVNAVMAQAKGDRLKAVARLRDYGLIDEAARQAVAAHQ